MKELKKFVEPELIKFEKPLDEVTLTHHGSLGVPCHPLNNGDDFFDQFYPLKAK